MTDKQQRLKDDLCIVPERDELASHGSQRRGSSLPAPRAAGISRASGGVRFLLTILVFGLLATGGAVYFFYTQSQGMLSEIDSANNRLRQLETRLSLTDEVAEQSSLGLLERVDFNFSEIDKLWAARNQSRANITENKIALEGQAETLTSMERSISAQSINLNEKTVLLGTIETRLETINTNLTSMSSLDLGQQLSRINEDLVVLKASMASQSSGLTDRVDSNEQDIESINIYRLQLNQTLNSIHTSINNLQQQLGGQTINL